MFSTGHLQDPLTSSGTVKRTVYKELRDQTERVACLRNSDAINGEHSEQQENQLCSHSHHQRPAFFSRFQRSHGGTNDELLDVLGCSVIDSDHEPCFEEVRTVFLLHTCRLCVTKQNISEGLMYNSINIKVKVLQQSSDGEQQNK